MFGSCAEAVITRGWVLGCIRYCSLGVHLSTAIVITGRVFPSVVGVVKWKCARWLNRPIAVPPVQIATCATAHDCWPVVVVTPPSPPPPPPALRRGPLLFIFVIIPFPSPWPRAGQPGCLCSPPVLISIIGFFYFRLRYRHEIVSPIWNIVVCYSFVITFEFVRAVSFGYEIESLLGNWTNHGRRVIFEK